MTIITIVIIIITIIIIIMNSFGRPTDLSVRVVTVAAGTVHAVALHLGGMIIAVFDPQVASLPPHIPVRARAFRQTCEADQPIEDGRVVSEEPADADRLGVGWYLPCFVQPHSPAT